VGAGGEGGKTGAGGLCLVAGAGAGALRTPSALTDWVALTAASAHRTATNPGVRADITGFLVKSGGLFII
jgi:hypothetical protein